MKKKIIIPLIAGVAVIASVSIYFFTHKGSSDSEKIYVNSVATIAGYGSTGSAERYSGVVDAQKAVTVNADSTKTIKECYVNVGDTVEVGTNLFAYDSDAINVSIDEAQLEIDKIKAEIDSLSKQIQDLQNEKASASPDEQLNYTVQIQSLTNEQTSNQYDLNSKQSDLDKLKASLTTTTVTSTVAGIVKTVGFENTSSSASPDFSDMGMSDFGMSDMDSGEDSNANSTGSSLSPYISIQPLGNYQIKGTLSEFDIASVEKDMDVIIRSRVDETKVVAGKVTSVNTDAALDTGSSSYDYEDEEGGGSAGEKATKYNFYVSYEDQSALMLGQHVYIEPGVISSDKKDGLWLPDAFIVLDSETEGYVWKSKNGKLTKQKVSLGEYNADEMTYEIKSGLTEKDFIAFPDDSLKEGAECEEADE